MSETIPEQKVEPATEPTAEPQESADLGAQTAAGFPEEAAQPEGEELPLESPQPETPLVAQESFTGALDALGRSFDPLRFQLGIDGKPRLNAHGQFVRKWTKRQGVENAGQPPLAGTQPAMQPTKTLDEFDLAADVACKGFYAIMIGTVSIEWKPENETEHEELRQSVAVYFRSKGVKDFPPGLAMFIVIAKYSAKRLQMPETKGKVATAIDWIKRKILRRK